MRAEQMTDTHAALEGMLFSTVERAILPLVGRIDALEGEIQRLRACLTKTAPFALDSPAHFVKDPLAAIPSSETPADETLVNDSPVFVDCPLQEEATPEHQKEQDLICKMAELSDQRDCHNTSALQKEKDDIIDPDDCTTTEPPSLLGTQRTVLPAAQTPPPNLLGTEATIMPLRDEVSPARTLLHESPPRDDGNNTESYNADTDSAVIANANGVSPGVSWSRDDSAARVRSSHPVLRFPLADSQLRPQRVTVATPYGTSNSPPPQNSRPLMWSPSPPLASNAHTSYRMTPSRQKSPRHDQQSPFRQVAGTSAMPHWPPSAVMSRGSVQPQHVAAT